MSRFPVATKRTLLAWLRSCRDERRLPPTHRDIARHFRLKSTDGALELLAEMRAEGTIAMRHEGNVRLIDVIAADAQETGAPIVASSGITPDMLAAVRRAVPIKATEPKPVKARPAPVIIPAPAIATAPKAERSSAAPVSADAVADAKADRQRMAVLRFDVEVFLKRSGKAPTSFGKAALGDLSFVTRLRKGTVVTPVREAKVRAWMQAWAGTSAVPVPAADTPAISPAEPTKMRLSAGVLRAAKADGRPFWQFINDLIEIGLACHIETLAEEAA